jgi:hypothetical protein
MATCRVDLEDSFKRALAQMPERAKDQVAVVIQSLEQKCKFEPDESEYILQLDRYITACEHVEGWGWSVFWYQEDDVIVVNAAPSTRIRLIAKIGNG